MPHNRFIETVRRVDDLIQRKATGTPAEMAARLGCSERTWYNFLDQLRNDYQFPIAYCRNRQCYYYTDETPHWDDFTAKVLSSDTPFCFLD
jgi:predicted DNA-binding transcriptional regulator YafY